MASRVTIRNGFKLSTRELLDERTLKRVGAEVATMIRERAFPGKGTGRDERGRPYSAYSTKRIYVSKASPPRPADMPAPRGGSKPKRKAPKTVRYDGGYSQYRVSIGRSSGAAKNLVLTGQTARALTVLKVDVARKTIWLGFSHRRKRAIALDELYDFMGLTPTERHRASQIIQKLAARRFGKRRGL